jgi:hypothetical protein
MSAKHVHYQIEALQQQVAALRSAVTNPAQGQGRLLARIEALQGSLQALQVAEGTLHQQHDELIVVHEQAAAVLRDSEARTPFCRPRWTGSSPLTSGASSSRSTRLPSASLSIPPPRS